jgi:hypothetical protein
MKRDKTGEDKMKENRERVIADSSSAGTSVERTGEAHEHKRKENTGL